MKNFRFFSKINSKREFFLSKNKIAILSILYIISFFLLLLKKSTTTYDDLYYFFLFSYSPLSFFSMEFLFKNREIKYLNGFALSNREIISFFIKKSILKLNFFSILGILLFSAFLYPNLNLIKLLFIQWIFYHSLFIATIIGIYGFTAKFILDDHYDSLKKIMSGGWTDPKLSPFLFAPAVIVAIVNIVHIFVAKAIEGFNNNYLIKEPLYISTILTLFMFIYGYRVFPKYIRRVYAFINNYQHFYESGSYKIEESFWEERLLIFFINLFSKNSNLNKTAKKDLKLVEKSNLIALIKKDIAILKRKYRIFSLLNYIFSLSLIFILIFIQKITVKVEIFIITTMFLSLIPTYFFIFLESELKSIFPIKKRELLISKILVSTLFISPIFFTSFITSLLYPILLLIVPIFILNFIFSYFLKEKYYILLFDFIFLSSILIF